MGDSLLEFYLDRERAHGVPTNSDEHLKIAWGTNAGGIPVDRPVGFFVFEGDASRGLHHRVTADIQDHHVD